MRFFNAGVEVAHDGSPVPSAVIALPPPMRLVRFSAGRPGFPTGNRVNNTRDAGAAAFGVTGSGEVCGLPRFSEGGMPESGDRGPPSTPSEVWAKDLPPDSHIDPYAPNRYGS